MQIEFKFLKNKANEHLCTMPSTRQLKFASLISKELGNIFLKNTFSLFHKQAMISVTLVEVSPDLGVAKVHLSLMLVEDKESFILEVQDKAKNIRQMLSASIKKQVRVVPELIFYLDDSAEYAMHMGKVLNSLHIPKEDKPNE